MRGGSVDRWHNPFGIEDPFPWLPIAAAAIPILIIAFAIVLGIVL